jgi:PBP1b-binding outer membrane lipoprotein LpoB
MRKTAIAILLVIAMLFVSCSPNATENKTPADETPSSGGGTNLLVVEKPKNRQLRISSNHIMLNRESDS